MKRILALLLFLGGGLAHLQAVVPGVNIYVAQAAQGGDTGADAANAHSLAWLNNSANWGTGGSQIGPGTTVHLVGTLTNTFTAQGSGTAANPITIFFEPNAMFSAPTLPNNSTWMGLGGQSWITIDGGVNGLIQLTDNGTVSANGGTLDYANNVCAINAFPIQNVTIQNLCISNMYNRQTNTEPIQGGGQDGSAVYWSGSGLTVSNCFFTGAQDMVLGVYSSASIASNLTVVGSTFSNYNHGVTIASGDPSNPQFYNVRISHNTFQGGDMFESRDGVDFGLHRNPIFFFNSGNGSGLISNIVISHNFIKHGANPQSHTAGTGAMFFDFNAFNAAHVRVFNNISTLAAPLSWSGGGGMINGIGQDVLVANNTAVMWQSNGLSGGSQISVGGSNAFAFNNIVVSQSGLYATAWDFAPGLNTAAYAPLAQAFSGIVSDYNVYNGQGGGSDFVVILYTNNNAVGWEPIYGTLSDFTNALSPTRGFDFDPHSLTNALQLNASFVPLSTDTAAVGNGTNLTAWGITDDYAGNPRPATGNWTIGAYQVTGTGGNILSALRSSGGGAGGGAGGGSSGGGRSSAVTAPGISNIVSSGASDITSGLLVQYKFNQTSGATAADSSGNGYAAALAGNAAWTTNGLMRTGAISFPNNNGAGSSADGASSPFNAFTYTGDWTISFWVYNNSFPGQGDFAATTAPNTGIFVGPGSWGFYDGSAGLNGSTALGAQAWYFIGVSKSRGTNYQLYLNGAKDNAGVLANVNVSVYGITVGNRGGSFMGMNGSIEDFRIFNRVLSAAEISTLATNGPDDVAATLIPPPTNFHVVSP